MARVKRGTTSVKSRKNILAMTKGYRNARKSKERQANEAIFHAGNYAFAHRRDKKNDFRKLWTININAALREENVSYSKFIGFLKKNNVTIDRKVLAQLAESRPSVFKEIVNKVKA